MPQSSAFALNPTLDARGHGTSASGIWPPTAAPEAHTSGDPALGEAADRLSGALAPLSGQLAAASGLPGPLLFALSFVPGPLALVRACLRRRPRRVTRDLQAHSSLWLSTLHSSVLTFYFRVPPPACP